MDAPSAVLIVGALGVWIALRIHHVASDPTAATAFLLARDASLTMSIVALVRRLLCYILFALPLLLVIVLTSSPTDWTRALAVVGVIGVPLGWLISGFTYPYLLGLCGPSLGSSSTARAGPQGLQGLLKRVFVSDLRSSAGAIRRLRRWVGASLSSGPTVRHVPIVVFVWSVAGILAFGAAVTWSAIRALVYFAVGAIYTLPAWFTFTLTEDQLAKLNPEPFLVSVGVGVVAMNDFLSSWKHRRLNRRRKMAWAGGLCLAETVLIVIGFVQTDDLQSVQSDTAAVVSGLFFAAFCGYPQ